MIYAFKAQSFPFWLKTRRKHVNEGTGGVLRGATMAAQPALNDELNGAQTLIKDNGQRQREQEEKQK